MDCHLYGLYSRFDVLYIYLFIHLKYLLTSLAITGYLGKAQQIILTIQINLFLITMDLQ